MNRALLTLSVVPLAFVALAGCGSGGSPAPDLHIERLPDVHPSLPAVPTIPPPPFPVQYGDQSYSVYGVRKRITQTMDTDVTVTAYIVEVYTPPVCEEGHQCPPARIPHVYLADARDEHDPYKRLTVVGYADNQQAVTESIDAAMHHHWLQPEGEGDIPVPYELFAGAKIKLHGHFARVSGSGFSQSDGLLEYRGHEILERTPEMPAAPDAGVPH